MAHLHHHASSGLKVAFGLNLVFTILEFVGGWLSGSIAILSDAVHDLGDTAALALALGMERAARAKPTDRYTYGRHRWTLAGALINALVLVFGSALILREAISRLLEPGEAKGLWMLCFAVLGVAMNGYAVWKTSRGKTLNEKIVTWHLFEDVIGWLAVLVGAVVLMVTGWQWIDPVLAIAISLFILINVIRRLREVSATFLQATPAEIDLAKLRDELERVEGIASLHKLHAWSLDGERHVVSCHAVLEPDSRIDHYLSVKSTIREILSRTLAGDVTIELEFEEEPCPEREEP